MAHEPTNPAAHRTAYCPQLMQALAIPQPPSSSSGSVPGSCAAHTGVAPSIPPVEVASTGANSASKTTIKATVAFGTLANDFHAQAFLLVHADAIALSLEVCWPS